MRDSQQEIKSTVTVNTSDIAAKAHEDKEVKDLDKISRKKSETKLEQFLEFLNKILQVA